MEENKVYKIYDTTVGFLIQDMITKSDRSEFISFSGFAPENKEHMTVLWGALYGASLTGKKVVVNLPLTKYMAFYAKNRKMKALFRRVGGPANVNVPDEIDTAYANVKGLDDVEGGLGIIYDEYYAPKKGK